MKATSEKVTRKGSTPIKVYCLPEERAAIEANAQAAGMSTSAYLLAVGQGYRVQGVTDFENVRELVRVNGDLGRLGGLLKLWLTDDARTARFAKPTATVYRPRCAWRWNATAHHRHRLARVQGPNHPGGR